MSLHKAVTSISDAMFESVQKLENTHNQYVWMGYVAQLRAALMACVDEVKPIQQSIILPGAKSLAALETKVEQKKLERQIDGEETYGERMVELCGLGNSNDGDFISVPASMPIGARTLIENKVFILAEGNELHYSAEETKKYLGCKVV